jgi:hypothetical protein
MSAAMRKAPLLNLSLAGACVRACTRSSQPASVRPDLDESILGGVIVRALLEHDAIGHNWPLGDLRAGLAFAAEVNRAGRDAWVEMDEIAIAVFRAKAPH